MIGILGYGTYITSVAGKRDAVTDDDQDSLTLAVETARRAFVGGVGDISPSRVGAVYLGGCHKALDERPFAMDLAEILGVADACHCLDVFGGGKVGTETLFAICNLVKPSAVEIALAVAVDPQPLDECHVSAMASGAAFFIGRREEEMLATVDAHWTHRTVSADETHAFEIEMSLARHLMAGKRYQPADFAYAIFQDPQHAFSAEVIRQMGFTEKQLQAGMLSLDARSHVSPLLSLAAVLDVAKPGEKVLMCSYGDHVGADAWVLTATENIIAVDHEEATVQNELHHCR